MKAANSIPTNNVKSDLSTSCSLYWVMCKRATTVLYNPIGVHSIKYVLAYDEASTCIVHPDNAFEVRILVFVYYVY